MNKEFIERGALYRKVAELEMLARDRYLDTPTNSPVYPMYMAQLGERTQLKFLIADFPTADVVEVVRCKDCVHYYEREPVCLKIYSDGNVSSDAWQERNPDDFCSYGERKGGVTDG